MTEKDLMIQRLRRENEQLQKQLEMKRGRWIIADGSLWCSACGFGKEDSRDYLFCPHCGARMEE